MNFQETIETIGKAIGLLGVAVMLGGLVLATVLALTRFVRKDMGEASFKLYRRGLGRAILLGLEILIAGDIVRTVNGHAEPPACDHPRDHRPDPDVPQHDAPARARRALALAARARRLDLPLTRSAVVALVEIPL